MKIETAQMYYGAAMTQIAEHASFVSISGVPIDGDQSRMAFRINETVGVYLKYAAAPKPLNTDYVFAFASEDKDALCALERLSESVCIALICAQDRQICCITYAELTEWFEKREAALGRAEDTSTLLVHLPPGQYFRCNMSMPGRQGIYLNKPQLVPRNRFPDVLFD